MGDLVTKCHKTTFFNTDIFWWHREIHCTAGGHRKNSLSDLTALEWMIEGAFGHWCACASAILDSGMVDSHARRHPKWRCPYPKVIIDSHSWWFLAAWAALLPRLASGCWGQLKNSKFLFQFNEHLNINCIYRNIWNTLLSNVSSLRWEFTDVTIRWAKDTTKYGRKIQ